VILGEHPGDAPTLRKALAIDLDGTLLSDNREASADALRSLARLSDIGHLVVFATGRPVRAVKDALPDWCAEFYWATCNGAWVLKNGETLARTEIPYDHTQNLAQKLLEQGMRVQIEANDIFHSDHPLQPGFTGDYAPLSEYRRGAACKILVDLVSENQIAQVAALLPPSFSMIATDGNTLLQIARRECSKLNAVRFILRKEDIGLDNLIAFGDDNNDIDLLAAAGMGVAMQNATPDVLAAADHITLSNNENGVGLVLKNILEEREPCT
jgi:5-amino-6-(5-phospho-D-ribitylamino)uracil phosphatase